MLSCDIQWRGNQAFLLHNFLKKCKHKGNIEGSNLQTLLQPYLDVCYYAGLQGPEHSVTG